jgi:hypothetical protein
MDIADIARKRISPVQFARNIILSLLLILFGTLGWDIGARWFAFEILGGIIGAGVMGMASSTVFDKLADKFIASDAKKMMDIIDAAMLDYPSEERTRIKKKITPAQLKRMYASDDRYEYAAKLIEKINSNYIIKGQEFNG